MMPPTERPYDTFCRSVPDELPLVLCAPDPPLMSTDTPASVCVAIVVRAVTVSMFSSAMVGSGSRGSTCQVLLSEVGQAGGVFEGVYWARGVPSGFMDPKTVESALECGGEAARVIYV